jgi:hypothetical protein
MRINRPPILRLIAVLLVAVPAIAWAFVKPVRVVAPTLSGVSCSTPTVCVDDSARLEDATRLYTQAAAFVANNLSPFRREPKVIFCSSQACADWFGLGARSAYSVGTFGTVIGPRAWAPYYVRHELIHQLQTQELGIVALHVKPSWFVEGMAYSLSEDPRQPLAEPFEGYRGQFLGWYRSIDKSHLWQAARAL